MTEAVPGGLLYRLFYDTLKHIRRFIRRFQKWPGIIVSSGTSSRFFAWDSPTVDLRDMRELGPEPIDDALESLIKTALQQRGLTLSFPRERQHGVVLYEADRKWSWKRPLLKSNGRFAAVGSDTRASTPWEGVIIGEGTSAKYFLWGAQVPSRAEERGPAVLSPDLQGRLCGELQRRGLDPVFQIKKLWDTVYEVDEERNWKREVRMGSDPDQHLVVRPKQRS